MSDTNLLLTNLKCRSIVSAKMTWAVMTIVVDADVASVDVAVVVRDVGLLGTAAVVTDVDRAWTTAALKAKEDLLWVTMAKKAAIVDEEDEVVVDSAAAITTAKKPRTVIEAIQVDTVNVAAMLNNAITMEASILAAKDSDNVETTAANATMVVDVEAVVEEVVPVVLDPDMMTVDIRITVVHATMMAATAGMVMVVNAEEVEAVAEVVAASTRAAAVVVVITKAVVAVEDTRVVICNELVSPKLRQVQIVKIAAEREITIESDTDTD